MPRYSYYGELTIAALKEKANDIRAQYNKGLISREDAHAEINIISAVMAQKQLAQLESDNSDEPQDEFAFGKED